MEPVAAALARLSKAQAKCAKELKALSESHADSPAWASAGIAAVARGSATILRLPLMPRKPWATSHTLVTPTTI